TRSGWGRPALPRPVSSACGRSERAGSRGGPEGPRGSRLSVVWGAPAAPARSPLSYTSRPPVAKEVSPSPHAREEMREPQMLVGAVLTVVRVGVGHEDGR